MTGEHGTISAPDLAQVLRICGDALTREGAERVAYLDAVCGTDLALRREVDAVLGSPLASDSVLDRPPWLPDTPQLSAGQRLGPYEVVGKVGEGGMGEVYKARDTRLDRAVAIKILPPHLAADPDRRRRFEQEARAVSALNHPHICTLYDVGSSHEHALSLYLVMEHLTGETLADCLRRGPLSVDRSIRYGVEIADALSAAHRAGIVHRDLKPANVMITTLGAKLLDFGVAELNVPPMPLPAASSDAARRTPATVQGTLAYVAPERLGGRESDTRTDIFSFGALLYEMLAGRRCFAGETAITVIGAILFSQPEPLSSLCPLVPPALERLVNRCLAKDPDERWQTARDLCDELKWISESSPRAHPADRARSSGGIWNTRSVTQSVLALVAGALLMAGGLTAWRCPITRPADSPRTSMRLTVPLPPDMPLAPAGLVTPAHDRPALALSPDGSHLAYVALIGGTTQICIRDMQTGSVTPLEHTSGGHTPFYSPDGAWLGFFAEDKLWKLPAAGGDRTALAEAWYPWGAAWGADNQIYFNRSEGEGVFRVPDVGGAVQPLTRFGLMPVFVRERPGVLLIWNQNIQYVDSRHPSEPRTVMAAGGRARYLSSGHLVYSVGRHVMAVPWDLATMTARGEPVALLDNVRAAPYGVAQVTMTDEGTLAYVPGRPQGLASFVWVDRNGKAEPLGLPEEQYETFALAPDGSRLAYGVGAVIFIWDRARRASSRLIPRTATGSPVRGRYPCWTPDGRFVIYEATEASSARPRPRLMIAAADGSSAPRDLWTPGDVTWADMLVPMSVSRDGSRLSFFRKKSSFDLFTMRLTPSPAGLMSSELQPFLSTPFGEVFGRISPDGHWMLFGSDQSGAYEVWATTHPTPGPMLKLSDGGGREPMWNPAVPGEVVYARGRAIYAVDVSRGPDHAGKPRLLFEGAYPDILGFGYDMAPDGRFLMLENKEILRPATTVTVLTNLIDYLRAHVPPKER